jgi:hypothetical protein
VYVFGPLTIDLKIDVHFLQSSQTFCAFTRGFLVDFFALIFLSEACSNPVPSVKASRWPDQFYPCTLQISLFPIITQEILIKFTMSSHVHASFSSFQGCRSHRGIMARRFGNLSYLYQRLTVSLDVSAFPYKVFLFSWRYWLFFYCWLGQRRIRWTKPLNLDIGTISPCTMLNSFCTRLFMERFVCVLIIS